MRWPLISVRVVDELERQLRYRDDLIERLRSERDRSFDEASRAKDQLIMSAGGAPVSQPVRAELQAETDKGIEEAQQLAKLFAGVDADNRMLAEDRLEN